MRFCNAINSSIRHLRRSALKCRLVIFFGTFLFSLKNWKFSKQLPATVDKIPYVCWSNRNIHLAIRETFLFLSGCLNQKMYLVINWEQTNCSLDSIYWWKEQAFLWTRLYERKYERHRNQEHRNISGNHNITSISILCSIIILKIWKFKENPEKSGKNLRS